MKNASAKGNVFTLAFYSWSIADHIFFSQNFLISTKNLSGALIFIFRRCFRTGSLSAFYKISVLKGMIHLSGQNFAICNFRIY